MRDSIRNDLFVAHACRDFWWRSVGLNDRREATLAVIENYVGFFWVCIPLFFQHYILVITALFDEDERSITFRNLLNMVRKNPNPNGQPIEAIESDIEASAIVARKLYKIRNKHIAHKSIEVFDQDFYKEAALSHNDVIDLWGKCWSIFEALSYHLDRSVESPLQDNPSQFDFVIDALTPKKF